MIAIADLSGELNGAKIVTQWFLGEIQSHRIQVTSFDSLPKSKYAYQTKRIFLGVRAVMFLIQQRLHGEKNLYLPLAGGRYLAFHFLYVALAKHLGYRIFLHHHSYSYITKKSSLSRRIFCSDSPNQINIFLTDRMRKDFENAYGIARASTTLTNAMVVADFNDDNWVPIEHASARRIKLVHYGRLSTVKGTDVVLDLYSRLLNENLNVSCLVAGSVSDENIREKIFELEKNFPHNFVHIQNYKRTELPQILFDCDFFLFPSKYENEAAPLVVYEAQFNGLVCYTSKAGSLESIVAAPGCTVELEDWLNTIMKTIKIESSSEGYKTQDSIFSKKKDVSTTMETEASDGRILLEKLISLMLEREPSASVE